jgi:hypothetical protein
MNLRFCIILLELFMSVSFAAAEPRGTYFKGDAPGAEGAGYDDSEWRQIDVPGMSAKCRHTAPECVRGY